MKIRSGPSAFATVALFHAAPFPSLPGPARAHAAVSFHAGGGAVSGGDDRPKPLAQAGLVVGPGIYGTLFLYGERFSIVSKRTQILSVGRQWTLPFSFTGRIGIGGGLSAFREETIIGSTSTSEEMSDESYNVGGNLGLKFRLLDLGAGFLDFDWNAHVFPAGLATIFLATGRRQTLTLTTGMAFK